MLLTLLVWISISFVCLAWGNGILRLTRTATSIVGAGSLFISMFTGLAVVGIVGLYLSLLMPLSLAAHLVVVLPAVIFYFFPANRQLVKEQWQEFKTDFSFPAILLAAAGLLMVLSISSYYITHPDTLGYHGQAIRWMEEYPAVPGAALADIRLGFQSWWFSAMALFRFAWLASHPFLFVNGCVASWFILFVADRIGKYTKRVDHFHFFGWLLLLAFCLLSWTQLRLTAASASPDFIAALYTWGSFYIFARATRTEQGQSFFLPFIFCCAALGIKLSTAPLILLALAMMFLLIRGKKIKLILALALTGLILVAPVIARNIISSGYPFFPSLFADVSPVEWKLPAKDVVEVQHYITAYARAEAESYNAAEKIVQLPFSQWAVDWCRRISTADQLLLLSIVLLFLYNLATAKRQWRQCDLTRKIIFITSFTGCIFWFVSAPDPRFGTTFLIPLAYSLYDGLPARKIPVKVNALALVTIALSLAILAYTCYRFVKFADARQFISPKGIVKTAYKEVSCQGITVSIPDDGNNCGMAPLPCLKQPCDSIKIIDMRAGFRHK